MAGNNFDFSPNSYLEKLYQNNQPEFKFVAETKAEWKFWREKLKLKIAELIGGLPGKNAVSSNTGQGVGNLSVETGAVEILAEKSFKDYKRLRIAYQVKDYLKIPAYLLIPASKQKKTQKKFPAVIIAHGHGNGSRETVGLNGAGENLDSPTCHNNLALDFVRKGYLVIIPELLGFGDRRLKEDYQKDPDLKVNPTANSCYRISSQLLLSGESILKYRLWDLISAVELLEKRKDIFNRQISVVGFSGGAPVAFLAALFENKIKAAAISGYTSYYKESILVQRHCLDNYLPGILNYAELPTMISAIAPKPLLIQTAEKDSLFPLQSAQKAYQEIKKVYRFLNLEEQLKMNILEKAEHSVSAAPIIDFFRSLN